MAEKNNGISSVMESLLKGANALMSTKTVERRQKSMIRL